MKLTAAQKKILKALAWTTGRGHYLFGAVYNANAKTLMRLDTFIVIWSRDE